MLQRYLEIAAARVKPSTMRIYTQAVRLWISPQLGSRRLCDLQPVDIHRLYETLRRRGLSARSIQITHNVLRAALKLAVRWNLLSASPMDRVDPPRVVRREMRALDPDQARRFLAAAREDRYGALWWLLLEIGMRPSEALALRWEDVHLARRVVRVQRSLVYVGRSYRFEEPKTRGGQAERTGIRGPGPGAGAAAGEGGRASHAGGRTVAGARPGVPFGTRDAAAPGQFEGEELLPDLGACGHPPGGFASTTYATPRLPLLLLADEHPKVVAERRPRHGAHDPGHLLAPASYPPAGGHGEDRGTVGCRRGWKGRW